MVKTTVNKQHTREKGTCTRPRVHAMVYYIHVVSRCPDGRELRVPQAEALTVAPPPQAAWLPACFESSKHLFGSIRPSVTQHHFKHVFR